MRRSIRGGQTLPAKLWHTQKHERVLNLSFFYEKCVWGSEVRRWERWNNRYMRSTRKNLSDVLLWCFAAVSSAAVSYPALVSVGLVKVPLQQLIKGNQSSWGTMLSHLQLLHRDGGNKFIFESHFSVFSIRMQRWEHEGYVGSGWCFTKKNKKKTSWSKPGCLCLKRQLIRVSESVCLSVCPLLLSL